MVKFLRVQTLIQANGQFCRMSRVCEAWSLDDLVEMREEDMEVLLGYYKPGTVPTFKQVQGEPDFEHYEFDGSFGWW